jgi:hypothetical protein
MSNNPTLLYITDLYYKANNREYYKEDLYITSQLKSDFDIVICHPLHSHKFEKLVDLIVIRNSGPVIYYKDYFKSFFERVNDKRLPIFNSLDGKGDMLGKQYLVTLSQENFPVISTIDSINDISSLPQSDSFIIKPKEGADSIGARRVTREELQTIELNDDIIQPFVDFEYEVSFYFIDSAFQYALYAPDKNERWKLESYISTEDDLAFAKRFVEWNTMTHGIQRVDACRTKEDELLLVELEDLNPFLSLDLLDSNTRDSFIKNFKVALNKALSK